MSSWLVHFENQEIVKTFWLQVTNSWNSWFFFIFRELVSCSKQTQHPFFLDISWVRDFVRWCNKHKRRIFFLISCVREFVRSYAANTTAWFLAGAPDFVSSCVANTTAYFLARVRDFVSSCVANTTAWFLARVRDFVSSCVASTTALVSITNLMNACCCWFSSSYLTYFRENMNILVFLHIIDRLNPWAFPIIFKVDYNKYKYTIEANWYSGLWYTL